MKQFSLTKTKTNCETKQPSFSFYTPSNCNVRSYVPCISGVPNLTLLHYVPSKKIKLVSFTPGRPCFSISGIHWQDQPLRTGIFFSKLTPLQNTKRFQGKSLKTLSRKWSSVRHLVVISRLDALTILNFLFRWSCFYVNTGGNRGLSKKTGLTIRHAFGLGVALCNIIITEF